MTRLFSSKPTVSAKGALRPGRPGMMAIAATLTLSLGVVGCGGGSATKSSAPAAAITKSEFLAKANAICGKADPVLSEATAKLASLRSDAQIATVVKTVYVPSIEAQITQIRALGTPAGGQAAVTSMLGLVQADLSRLESKPALVATDVFANFARVAHPYGLTACAPLS
jgi:hypothetical protein